MFEIMKRIVYMTNISKYDAYQISDEEFLIEAQVGEYTGEDDIVRIEDDFEREINI